MKAFRIAGQAQGTSYQISYYAPDSLVGHASVDSLFSRVDSSLSVYKNYSLLSQFNSSEKSIQMDAHLLAVVNVALEIYEATGGVSDPTVLPLVNAWGFGPQKPLGDPDSVKIKEILTCIGGSKLHISGTQLYKDLPCVQVDLNGIAQGYTVDLLADFLEARGIINYLVELGGEIRVRGKKYPAGETMKLGIEAPLHEEMQETIIFKVIETENGALTTSGNYRKFHLSGGKKISHLIDPASGWPFNNELVSVSVYTKKAIIADGYDHALMGMGLKKALSFLEKHREIDAYFIYRKADGSIGDTATRGFYKLMK